MPTLDTSQPYPWPYDGCLDPQRLALVVAGAQARWVEASSGSDRVIARILEVGAAVRSAGGTVVLLRHVPPPSRRPTRFPPPAGASGSEPAPLGAPGDLVVRSGGVDGFFGGPLDIELRSRGIDRLAFAGFGGEACVDSTLRSANDRGYECLTLTDAVAPFDADLGRHALHSITLSGGIFGAVAPSSALLAALVPTRPPVPVEAP